MIALRGVPFTLVSPHAPEQCAERLRALVVNPVSWFGLATLFSEKPLVGEASASSLRLTKRTGHGNNALRPTFTATLEPSGSGTRLDCRIGLPMSSVVLLTLIAVSFSLASACVLVNSLVALADGEFALTTIWPAIFLLTLLASCIWHGRYLARGEKEFLERTVTEALDARRE
jgi:hypothetical protein